MTGSVREKLPAAFLEEMEGQLGDEFANFLKTYGGEAHAGLRINSGKAGTREVWDRLPFVLARIPWTGNAYYVKKDEKRTAHPYYFAGLYYLQEPSAMLPASRLPIEPGDRVLDLCAAPGGKATELASRLQGKGLLVANDVSASRAKALVKNLTLWGAKNACITAETPQRLFTAFGCSFDKILVDAPCSGEGMFRKDSSLIASWKERGPAAYAALQKEILFWAVQMLAPGGMLLYSTCTFSKEEDEGVVEAVLEEFPELRLVPQEMLPGFAHGLTARTRDCVRIYPHKVKGEGHFLALFQKAGGVQDRKRASEEKRETKRKETKKKETKKKETKVPEAVHEFLQRLPVDFFAGYRFEQIGENCYFVPDYPLPGQLRYLLTGVALGTLKKGRFEPGQHLAMLLNKEAFDAVLDLPAEDERVIRYLKGETIDADETMTCTQKGGWILLLVDGYPLGWGKLVGGCVRNKYYPGWRLQ